MDGHKKIMNEEQVIDLASDYQENVLIPEEEEDMSQNPLRQSNTCKKT